MKNNITKEDLDKVIKFLKNKNSVLTQSANVELFEKKWSKWLGVKYSVFVNSGSSANLITLSVLRELYGLGEIIVPPLTWVSDIASVLQNGFEPVFADINIKTLSMNENEILKKITKKTKAVFITYAQGFNGLTRNLLNELKKRSVLLIEDVCESHGAKFNNRKLGSFGLMSNFSFYYAHHISTIEGGMVSTNNSKIYELLRIYRSHGLLRETKSQKLKNFYANKYPDLNKEFIFLHAAYNLRNNEIGAIIGINQLKRLNKNINLRNKNFEYFIKNLDRNKFVTNFEFNGCSNYAFNLILKNNDDNLMKKIMISLEKNNIEFRRGSAGGGNQLRQPYLSKFFKKNHYLNFPVVEHVHFYSCYIGNYPNLTKNDIKFICDTINKA